MFHAQNYLFEVYSLKFWRQFNCNPYPFILVSTLHKYHLQIYAT
jgi:hypothetical protein